MNRAELEKQIVLALKLLQQGDVIAAERALLQLVEQGSDPRVLYALGTIRLGQCRFFDAEVLLSKAREHVARHPHLAFSHGQALVELGREEEAVEAYQTAITLKPEFIDAYYELGSALQRLRRFGEAEQAYRRLLVTAPRHVPAKLALGAVLIEAMRPADAEEPLREALREPAPPRLAAMLHTNLGLALRRQRKD